MNDNASCKRILGTRAKKYNDDRIKGRLNVCGSPMFEILNVAENVNLLDTCINMVLNGHYYAKRKLE